MAYVFADYANRLWPIGKAATAALMTYAVAADRRPQRRQYPRRAGRQVDAEPADRREGLGAGRGGGGGDLFRGPGSVAGGCRPCRETDYLYLAMIFVLLRLRRLERNGLRRPPRSAIRRRTSSARCCWAPWPSRVIYVLVNLAFLHALGLAGMRETGVAADVLPIGDRAPGASG